MNPDTLNPLTESESSSIFETVSILFRAVGFVFRATPFYFLVSNSTGIMQAGFAVLLLWFGKIAIDRVIVSLDSGVDLFFVLLPVFAIAICRVLQSGLGSCSQFVDFMVAEKVNIKSYALLLNKTTKLDLAFFESPKYNDRLYQARRYMGSVYGVTRNLLGLVSQSCTLVAMFGLLTILHPLTFLVLIFTISPRFFVEGYSARRKFDLENRLTRNNRICDYFEHLLLNRRYVNEIKIFGLEDYFTNKFLKARDLLVRADLKLNLHLLKVELFLDVLGVIGLSLVWMYAVFKANAEEISIGDLFMVFGAAQSCKSAIQGWFRQGGHVFESSLRLTRFFEIVDLDALSVEGALNTSRESPTKGSMMQVSSGIEFKNVSFRYPGTHQWILKDISFVIPSNARLAIVGENGAGKTTLVKLLTRLYDPIDGSVFLDGRDYRDYDIDELRNGITAIFQDFARYDFSVADNIGVGYVAAMNDRPRIVQSAKRGGAHDMAMKLPNQYDTMLGRTYDEGVDLSGGEWQNLAISRAFMSDAHLFILDEPTAALDAFKEAEVFDRFAHLTEGCTVVLVSHRFSTVRMADLICVIEDGRIIEYGSHQELIKLNGKYRRMYDAQAERYR